MDFGTKVMITRMYILHYKHTYGHHDMPNLITYVPPCAYMLPPLYICYIMHAGCSRWYIFLSVCSTLVYFYLDEYTLAARENGRLARDSPGYSQTTDTAQSKRSRKTKPVNISSSHTQGIQTNKRTDSRSSSFMISLLKQMTREKCREKGARQTGVSKIRGTSSQCPPSSSSSPRTAL